MGKGGAILQVPGDFDKATSVRNSAPEWISLTVHLSPISSADNMPAQPSMAYATLSQTIPSAPYILSILPSPSGHLILRHPAPYLTIADPQTLQAIGVLQGGHTGNVSDVVVDEQAIWSGGKDGGVVRWDERERKAAINFKGVSSQPGLNLG